MQFFIPFVGSAFIAGVLASPVESAGSAAALEASKALNAGLLAPEPANFLANSTEDGLSKRALTHLYVCTDIDFQGTCQNLLTYTQKCYNLGNGFKDTISSLGPDQGTSCDVFQSINCDPFTGDSYFNIVYPGINDLRDKQYNMNDKIASYSCS